MRRRFSVPIVTACLLLSGIGKAPAQTCDCDIPYEIARRFGEEFTYHNENGNLAIDRRVLKAFRKLTGDSVVWERGERLWRRREGYDQVGRQQDWTSQHLRHGRTRAGDSAVLTEAESYKKSCYFKGLAQCPVNHPLAPPR